MTTCERIGISIKDFVTEREKDRIDKNSKWSRILKREVSGEAGIFLDNQEKQIQVIRDSGSRTWDDVAINDVYKFVIEFTLKNPNVVALRSTVDYLPNGETSKGLRIYPHLTGVVLSDLQNAFYRDLLIRNMNVSGYALCLIALALDYPQMYRADVLAWIGE